MMSTILRGAMCLGLIVFVLAGCGDTAPSQTGTPGAGVTESDTPVAAAPEPQQSRSGPEASPAAAPVAAPKPAPKTGPNLLTNGGFQQWKAFPLKLNMAPVAGADLAYEFTKGEDGTATLVWSKADSDNATYGERVVGLRGDIPYVLRFSAENRTASRINVAVFGASPEGETVRLLLSQLDTEDGPKDYALAFQAGGCESMKIVASCAATETKFPAKVTFKEWALAPQLLDVPAGWSSTWAREGESVYATARIVRDAKSGNLALRQEWREADAVRRVSQLLGTTVEGIEPNTDYQLSFRSRNPAQAGLLVAVYGVNPADVDDGPERLLLVEAPRKDGLVPCVRELNSGKHTALRIVTACPAKGNAFPVQCMWDDWSLTKLVSK
ncbi:MAG: hypothetical protein GY851_17740 [bacterium]|nr:hypothetical protein [bacterium]